MNNATSGRNEMRAAHSSSKFGTPCNSTLENGAKVNRIKQKFERNISPDDESTGPQLRYESLDQKECLRRSLSASPVKSKKNFKPDVSRQLSNPGGKNIKRTPAFRGEKPSRTKNLQSPIKDKQVSIVDRNVKIFEETKDGGGNTTFNGRSDEGTTRDRFDRGRSNSSEDRTDAKSRLSNRSKPTIPKGPRPSDNNGVRTTVISRQTNISPIYNRDNDRTIDATTTTTNKKSIDVIGNVANVVELEKFTKNGAEYTRVKKSNRQSSTNDEKSSRPSREKEIDNPKTNGIATVVPDVREELSRRIRENSPYDRDASECDTTDASDDRPTGKKIHFDDKRLGLKNVELSDTLKAALRAPLPVGPPPKKPPRTFVHTPIKRIINALEETKLRATKFQDSTSSDEIATDATTRVDENPKIVDSKNRDSKKMLAKLENVLIQHRKALGTRVISPRTERNDSTTTTTTTTNEKSMRNAFCNRLSRTLEDSKKNDGSTRSSNDAKTRKHSTFECLPSLNCASWTSVYEQIGNPDFKSYFEKTNFTDRSTNSSSKLDDDNNIDDSPTSDRSSSELSTFNDGKKRDVGKFFANDERVYAEPFAFDENSGIDITGYSNMTSDERNYFSRNLRERGFECSNENFGSAGKNCRALSSRLSPSDDTPDAKPGLHYMCTSIKPLVYEDNNNEVDDDRATSKMVNNTIISSKKNLSINPEVESPTTDKIFNRIKADQLLNQAFGRFSMASSKSPTDSNASSDTDSVASSPSIGDQPSSFNKKLRIFETRENVSRPTRDDLHRSLTEKRKNYVRRVSSKYSENREIVSHVDRRDKLFQVCLLVELNLSTREPYIKDKYPVYAKTPAWIENFCFPDATDWPPNDTNQNQFYSLVLMDEKGNRRYGYCCRVRPEDGPILPLAYCLITKYRASGFYQKVLLELESRHGLPDKKRRSFIEELYNSAMPRPGQSLRMRMDDGEKIFHLRSTTNGKNHDEDDDSLTKKNFFQTKYVDSNDEFVTIENRRKSSTNPNETLLANERTISEITIDDHADSNFMDRSIIMRSGDPRLEERDMSQLFDAVSDKVLIVLFGSLLLERKVVLMCEKLSKLSSCVDALESLLYPFTWPHTFIPVLPDIPGLSEILQAPLPYVIGILKAKNSANKDVALIRDGIVVDLDTSKIINSVGDESTILPSRLQKGIRSALQLVHSRTKSGEGIRNLLVSEAFLRVLVETCSHYDSHLVTQQDGKIIFQKESFVRASSLSKTVQYFLEWFVETTMFNAFIQDRIARTENGTMDEMNDVKLFNQRSAEFRLHRTEKTAESKNGFLKKKTLGDRLKDLTNFHT